MNIRTEKDGVEMKFKFSLTDLVLFCLGEVSDNKRSDIGREIIFDDDLMQMIRTIRRVQREFGDDYDTIMKKLNS